MVYLIWQVSSVHCWHNGTNDHIFERNVFLGAMTRASYTHVYAYRK